ncbi:hypothetical protein OIB37_19060 [Streptomyces sp. NBC_00820]|uniref:anti-sigma factor family protein n=1 Tax=Streptomyces sp. NBC_00820 TaxID=2975842 RepID=UPI002ED4811D|nr:hypothetical protein OIB37_19060 [Streptomyces sp. NBC_00820]
MTSSTDTAGHPDVDEIADLTEGLLAPARSADVQRHLEGCAPCADVRSSLEEIQGMLSAVPTPSPMPADVASRIDAALAAEARVSRETSTSLSAGASASSDSRETSSLAGRPAGRPHAATGPGRKDRGRGRRRRTVALGAVLTAAVLGTGSLLVLSLGGGSPDTTAHSTPSASVSAFSGSSIQNQVKGLLATKKGPQRGSERPQRGIEPKQSTPGSTESANTFIQTAVPVPDCVRQAVGSTADVLGAKTGTYAGRSAYLVVLPVHDDPARITAYVVDASCTVKRPASPGTVLLKQSLVRP